MEEYITIALPKGKLFKRSLDLLGKVGYSAEGVSENSRKLVIANEETKVRFIITKTVDLPTYVEYGAADIGIIGKDVLLEEQKITRICAWQQNIPAVPGNILISWASRWKSLS